MKMIMQAIDYCDRDYCLIEEEFVEDKELFLERAQESTQALSDKYTFYDEDIPLEVVPGVKTLHPMTIWRYPELAPAQTYNGWDRIDTNGESVGIVIDLLGQRIRLNYLDSISEDAKRGVDRVVPIPGKIEIEILSPDFKLTETSTRSPYLSEGSVRIFGQPRVVQNDIFYKPPHPGWQMYPLFCFYNCWGDCGTENIFVILNDRQQIVEFVWEASCH